MSILRITKLTNGTDFDSGFDVNKSVVWGTTSSGGILHALTNYRDNLSYAVTQADVVGHDMGGLLARVYASDHEAGYNPDYKRHENFMEGDINRLITIATPHFGSEFREFQSFLHENTSIFSLPDFTLMDWLYQNALVFYYWYNGIYHSQAVLDQAPNSDALLKIGATDIPSHAIACRVPFGKGNLKDPVFDNKETYYDLFWYTTLLLYNNDSVRSKYLNDYKLSLANSEELFAGVSISGREASEIVAAYEDIMYFKTMVEDGLWYAGQVMAVLDGTWTLPATTTILKYAFAETGMSDYGDPLLEVFTGNISGIVSDWINTNVGLPSADDVILTYLSTNDKSMEVIRSLIFNNDYNDGVVRVQSQTGGLEEVDEKYVTDIENAKILHAFSNQHPQVQQTVASVLDNGMTDFCMDGFPNTDKKLKLYYPDSTLELLSAVAGPEAICRSGMVPSHAQAFAEVADKENVIIITRPVNPDGTPLIKCNAATKVMNVKPKSSNWGPQKGYLPQKQRYSKIWKLYEGDKRIEMVGKYDTKVMENIDEGITVANPLTVSTCSESFEVFIDNDEYMGPNDWTHAENEIVLVRTRAGKQEVCNWNQNSSELEIIEVSCRERTPEHDLEPFMVMANPPVGDDPPVNLTADYDLLMFGFHSDKKLEMPDPPKDIPFDPERGQITPRQKLIIDKLNAAVASTGYTGGGVSHHGPENQFSQSPYVDYPLTVFAPGSISYGVLKEATGGKILSIPMGPKGFRDIHLKRFVNAMREQRYDLYGNPNPTAKGWKWSWDEDKQGYNLEDHKDLPAYVEEIKNPKCGKDGAASSATDCSCPKPPRPDIVREEPTSWLTGFTGDNTTEALSMSVYPNPVASDVLNMDITNVTQEHIGIYITDAFGNIVYTKNVESQSGDYSDHIDISSLEKGVYTITVSPGQLATRFVRL